MAEFLSMTKRFDVLLLSFAIDMGLHTDAGISAHRKTQAPKVLANLPASFQATRQPDFEKVASTMLAIFIQLYVQAVDCLLQSLNQFFNWPRSITPSASLKHSGASLGELTRKI